MAEKLGQTLATGTMYSEKQLRQTRISVSAGSIVHLSTYSVRLISSSSSFERGATLAMPTLAGRNSRS